MTLLLDTHAFLWFIAGDSKLSDQARLVIENPDNEIFISIASLWEMAIKASLGKLILRHSLKDIVKSQIEANGLILHHISVEHLTEIVDLPFHHRDPFDRLLAVQSRVDDLTLVSRDTAFDAYGIQRLW